MKVRTIRRRGGAAVVALVCLTVIALVIVGLLRVNASRAGQIRQIAWRTQADWLVEAGLERAALRLGRDPSYDGETWSIPAESLGGRAGTVVITIAPEEDQGQGAIRVAVQADYPADSSDSDRVRKRKTFGITPGFNLKESQE